MRSLVYIVMKSSLNLNTTACRLVALMVNRRASRHQDPDSSVKFHTLNLPGLAKDITAPTIQTIIANFERQFASSLRVSSHLKLSKQMRPGRRFRRTLWTRWRRLLLSLIKETRPNYLTSSEVNLIAMRLGPGKHLKGRTLMGGIVKPEEFDYFHEVK